MNIEQLNMNQMFWLQSRHSIPTFEPLIPLQVNIYQMYSRYIDDVPSIIVSLYLGPLSGEIESKAWYGKNFWADSGRKPIMLVPFLGHIISGRFLKWIKCNKKHHLRNSHDPYLSLPQLGCQVCHLWDALWKFSISQIYLVIWILHSLRWLFLA